MLQHEREYFVSRLRSGTYYIDYDNIKLKILSPNIEDEFFINEAYRQAYEEAYSQEVMTHEDMLSWMFDKGLWTEEDENKIKDLAKNIRSSETLRALLEGLPAFQRDLVKSDTGWKCSISNIPEILSHNSTP